MSYPPVGFYFRLGFLPKPSASDLSFSEVSGLESKLKTEEIVKGGISKYEHGLPKKAKYDNLVLKRGVISTAQMQSEFILWVRQMVESNFEVAIVPKTIYVILVSQTNEVLITWEFQNAYPIKWSIEPFEENFAIESLELAYGSFKESNH